MRSRAFNVVAEFERALSEFTAAPYVVTTDSCTNALFLALKWSKRFLRLPDRVQIPKYTYVGVVQAARNAELAVEFSDEEWSDAYSLEPTPVVDAAKLFEREMYERFPRGSLVCVSFQAGKHLPIGRGGAILLDNHRAAGWLRKVRLDGRTAGADYSDNTYQSEGHHIYMTPPDAARGLWLMTYLEDDDKCDWTEYPDLSEAIWL